MASAGVGPVSGTSAVPVVPLAPVMPPFFDGRDVGVVLLFVVFVVFPLLVFFVVPDWSCFASVRLLALGRFRRRFPVDVLTGESPLTFHGKVVLKNLQPKI